jgi:transposase
MMFKYDNPGNAMVNMAGMIATFFQFVEVLALRPPVAFEAGRDAFWLARWLRAHDIEAHVIHASSIAVSREHRRAKTDRLDTELLKRAFLGWLRGERDHCKMVAIPTIGAI